MAHLIAAAGQTDFLTAKALGTFSGASVATVICANTFRSVVGKDWRWVPFLFAALFSYVAAQYVGNPHSLGDWLLIGLNACLLYCTALGASEVLVAADQRVVAARGDKIEAHGGRPTSAARWARPWLRQ